MRKILFLFASLLIFFSVNAQEKHETYCEIVGTGNFVGTKVKIEIDFGQKNNFWRGYNEKFLVDEQGDKISFNSMVDAMNFMAKLGWKFKQAYVVTEPGTPKQNVYHFLLSKNIISEEEITEGFKVLGDYKENNEIESEKKESINYSKKKVPLFKRNIKEDEPEK